jgi:predicted PhzF superfamily epimerase YddE/YHI9
MNTLRVFVNDDNEFGNPVGIIVDEGRKIDVPQRQAMAAKSGFSEIVFVNDLETNDISLFNPIREVRFAGHAVLGTLYFLTELKKQNVDVINCIAGKVKCRVEKDRLWVEADITMLPPWQYEQLESADVVEAITAEQSLTKLHTYVWAWIDQGQGLIRARTFANDWGIPEDEANGSGTMKLANTIQREIKVIHGKGSIVLARPNGLNVVELGGKVFPVTSPTLE